MHQVPDHLLFLINRLLLDYLYFKQLLEHLQLTLDQVLWKCRIVDLSDDEVLDFQEETGQVVDLLVPVFAFFAEDLENLSFSLFVLALQLLQLQIAKAHLLLVFNVHFFKFLVELVNDHLLRFYQRVFLVNLLLFLVIEVQQLIRHIPLHREKVFLDELRYQFLDGLAESQVLIAAHLHHIQTSWLKHL